MMRSDKSPRPSDATGEGAGHRPLGAAKADQPDGSHADGSRAHGAVEPRQGSALEVLGIATRLGLTSFGGPVAHLGYFHDAFVTRRKWVSEHDFADLVALCQFLPGPASSQLLIVLGTLRAGVLGGLAAWVGFTLPSAVALVAFAFGVQAVGVGDEGWLHGLKLAAVAVVAQAVWMMARSLAPDRSRGTIAILAAAASLLWTSPLSQVLIIVAAGLIGWRLLPAGVAAAITRLRVPFGQRFGIACWAAFFLLLLGLPLLRSVTPIQALALFDSFYRVGALVFGGGHVVLPLLYSEVVPTGWATAEQFVAGYGAAQAVPGPLFTFAAYLGAVSAVAPNGIAGAAIATVAIFLPSFLLVYGALPFWSELRSQTGVQAALRGVNAAVVGLLLAALYDPVWTSAVERPADVALVFAAFGLLVLWRLPPWLVVVLAALAGTLVGAI